MQTKWTTAAVVVVAACCAHAQSGDGGGNEHAAWVCDEEALVGTFRTMAKALGSKRGPAITSVGEWSWDDGFGRGEREFVPISRELTVEERMFLALKYPKDAPQPARHEVGGLSASLLVSKASAVDTLTFRQLRQILTLPGKEQKIFLLTTPVCRQLIKRLCLSTHRGSFTEIAQLGGGVVECTSEDEVVTKVKADAKGIGIVLSAGKEFPGVKEVKLATEECPKGTLPFINGRFNLAYPLRQPIRLLVSPECSEEGKKFAEFVMSDDGLRIAEKSGIVTRLLEGKLQGDYRLAEMKAGRGVRISAMGPEGVGKGVSDLANEYVKAKAVVQVQYSPGGSEASAIAAFIGLGAGAASGAGAPSSMPASRPAAVATTLPAVSPFVKAGGMELLFHEGKPSDRTMKTYGPKWKALGPDGAGPEEFPIAGRAVAIVVNRANAIERLSMDWLRAIYAGELDDWTVIGGTGSSPAAAPAGGKAGKVRVNVFGLRGGGVDGKTPAAAEIFFRECLPAEKLKRVTFKKDTAEVLAAVSMDPQAIGFVDASAIPADGQTVKVVGIDLGKGGEPAASQSAAMGCRPTGENVRNGSYPLSQRVYLYVHPKASETARDFAKFLATCGGSEASAYSDTRKAVVEAYRKNGLVGLGEAATERATSAPSGAGAEKEQPQPEVGQESPSPAAEE